MTDIWKLAFGAVLLVAGVYVFYQGYVTWANCGSITGQIWTFVSSIIGGNGAQACYNARLAQIGGGVIALLGLVVIYTDLMGKKGRK